MYKIKYSPRDAKNGLRKIKAQRYELSVRFVECELHLSGWCIKRTYSKKSAACSWRFFSLVASYVYKFVFVCCCCRVPHRMLQFEISTHSVQCIPKAYVAMFDCRDVIGMSTWTQWKWKKRNKQIYVYIFEGKKSSVQTNHTPDSECAM